MFRSAKGSLIGYFLGTGVMAKLAALPDVNGEFAVGGTLVPASSSSSRDGRVLI